MNLIEYLKTPAGCEGGNIKGKNWLFGLEYGGTATSDNYQNLKISHRHNFYDYDEAAKIMDAYPYNQRLAKLEAAKHGWQVENYKMFISNSKMLTSDGQYYFGNLGAIGMAHDTEEHFFSIKHILGLNSKEELKQLEVDVRSELFQSWIEGHTPNCICCFGSTNAHRFIKTFTGKNGDRSCWNKLDGLRYYHQLINQGKTNLFVLPHPTPRGPHGLISNERIQIFGYMIHEKMVKNGFTIF